MEKEEDLQEERRFAEVLKTLADSSTWHGVAKIASSPQRAVKCLWCIFLMTALGTTLWNLSVLFETFYARPVQTTVELEFSSLRFPAVSFCNLNPVRQSQIGMAPELMKALRGKKTDYDFGGPSSTPSSSSSSTTSSKLSTSSSTTTTVPSSETSNVTVDRNVTETDTNITGPTTVEPVDDDDPDPRELWEEATQSFKTKFRNESVMLTKIHEMSRATRNVHSAFVTSMDPDELFAVRPYRYYRTFKRNSIDSDETAWMRRLISIHGYRKRTIHVFSWQGLNNTIDRFLYRTTRIQMGHQKEDFIHRAKFGRKHLNISENFKLFTSSDYGNCFTMDSPEYKAWRSGPEHGIMLRLNLEVDEYIKNFASGYGVRMVFHEPGTFPMPAEEGLTLSPGYESVIGLRMTTISRLGHPFGNCTNGDEFRQLYNVSYSVSSCMEFCRVESTIKACHCIPFDAPDHHFSDDIPACDNDDDTEEGCADNVENDFMQGKLQCDCQSPCNETTYEKTTSGRRWPNKDYLEKVLMVDECSTNRSSMEEACSQLRNHDKAFDYDRYTKNFISARIYFEDLNYQIIKEEEFYKPVRFVCDIGGAMGLFLGGSLLSFLELFQLMMEVVLHCLRSKKKEQPPGSENTLQNQSTQTTHTEKF